MKLNLSFRLGPFRVELLPRLRVVFDVRRTVARLRSRRTP